MSKNEGGGRKSESGAFFHHPGRRVPTMLTADGYDELSYLDDDDKRVGREIFDSLNMVTGKQDPEHAALQAINPSFALYTADPKLYKNQATYYGGMLDLVCGMNNEMLLASTNANGADVITPDIQRRFIMGQLIVTKVAHECRNEWALRLMASLPNCALSKEQFALLDQPQSAVWDEEERLILEFTSGFVHGNTTDELFARAEAYWGRKQLLRYSEWIAFYIGNVLMAQLNVTDAEKARRRPA